MAPCSARADLVNGCVLFHPASRPRPSALPLPLDPKPAFRFLANGTARVDGRLRARPSPPRIWDYFFRMHSQKQNFWVAVHERFCCLMADLSFHFRLIIPIYKVNSKAWDAAASSPPSAGSAIPERFDFMAGKRPPVGLACVCVRLLAAGTALGWGRVSGEPGSKEVLFSAPRGDRPSEGRSAHRGRALGRCQGPWVPASPGPGSQSQVPRKVAWPGPLLPRKANPWDHQLDSRGPSAPWYLGLSRLRVLPPSGALLGPLPPEPASRPPGSCCSLHAPAALGAQWRRLGLAFRALHVPASRDLPVSPLGPGPGTTLPLGPFLSRTQVPWREGSWHVASGAQAHDGRPVAPQFPHLQNGTASPMRRDSGDADRHCCCGERGPRVRAGGRTASGASEWGGDALGEPVWVLHLQGGLPSREDRGGPVPCWPESEARGTGWSP